MPLYEYHCNRCNQISEKFYHIDSVKKQTKCDYCNGIAVKIISKTAIKSFKPQTLDIIDDNEKPIHVRNSGEVKDAIKKYNDSKWADKGGKVAVLE